MAFRIEVLFSGPASENELDRAKIVGSTEVVVAIDKLNAALHEAGLDSTVSVRSVNSSIGSGSKHRSRLHAGEPPVATGPEITKETLSEMQVNRLPRETMTRLAAE